MLVDSHCHLDFPVLSADRDAVVARARAAGIGTMLTIGTKLKAFDGVRAVAEAYDGIYCSVGIHPHEAEAEPGVQAEQLLAHAGHPKVVAFGETGLDYYYEHAPREAQKANFRAHIQAARTANLPVIVHTRDADEDTEEILQHEMGQGGFTGVLHCFTSGERLARVAVELGFYISFSGILTFKKTEALQAIASDLPLDRILVETDAPYLAPIPHRGRTNEPALVVHTAAKLAALRGLTPDALAAATTANFHRLFHKTQPYAG
ncbi:MAG: TatD family hydrolase [Alphaproteobacteria bacterium]|nr:TatD family hydrolase [Alphaproteobacteria bacterium]